MNALRLSPYLPAIIPTVLTLGMLSTSGQSQQQNAATNANSEIEQLAVGNYWTGKETTFAENGEVDTEAFSTVVVVKKETLGGRECFQIKQVYHDTPRFDPKQAGADQEKDYYYWEFLEDGNLYYFDSAPESATPPTEKKTPDDPAPAADSAAPSPPDLTPDKPALYLKYPAAAGDLYQSFDTVGTVIATDRVVQTPAGEFTCHVYGFLTDASETLPHRSYTVEYWCPGIGFVKLEEFEIDGTESRLTYSLELLAYHLEDGRSGGSADGDERRSKIENVH